MNDFVEASPTLDLGVDQSDILKGIDEVNRKIEERRAPEKKEEQAAQEPAQKPKYSSQELLTVFDALIFEGKYVETFKGRKISVTFRSRTGKDSVRISQALDKFEGKTFMSVQTYTNLLTLSHSLVSFNDRNFGDDEIKEKYELLSSLPDAILTILVSKLQEFDEKVWLAMEEGRKNF